MKIKKNKNA